jgi:hypothetical protein
MATIREKVSKNGVRYYVSIRRKNETIYSSFGDKETAELFAFIKEKVIDEMENFDIPSSQLIRLKDAFEIKKMDMISEQKNKKSLQDLNISYSIFESILSPDFYLIDINWDKLQEITKILLNKKVQHGGNYKTLNNLKLISPTTVRKHLMNLSSLYGNLIKKGINLKNPFTEFMPYFMENFMIKE